ncbi:Hsp70 family protein [Candidatus Accumulibacter vicinus]|uniref:Heat shock protein 70 n=1 Tax=Candidatus Accumulibacter vicinus TaxID=2954382 RepID=A0A084Y4S0_9PROT|nr:Hsp70 family protein [Candidatus Accumulibacter vicinus]KFB69714.1 MAG: Heat shock protein 70 [Candidatus Accumulibacter vicinus]
MSRQTIDFGIDLGTTNSSIAVFSGTATQVFMNHENLEYTPSAVWMDPSGNTVVGRRAKEQTEKDRENAFSEFKLQMGTTHEYVFARTGRKMRAEELSAGVLKDLRDTVRRRSGEEVTSAVVTVPAAFELPQCEATKRAAELAGFSVAPLLQEPVAAALAHGFQAAADNKFWLVYDFGGGTFDAAIIKKVDGTMQVVNHAGDNHLGGKLIDWAIVEQLFIPAVAGTQRLRDFSRHNAKYAGAVAKLKLAAEKAKIDVSRDASTWVEIDFLCNDDRGQPIEFRCEVKRDDVERLMVPFVARSINVCRNVLTASKLGTANIEKVLLVGGPTLTPFFRDRLADPREGLGIPLDFSIDPLTVVARGAAIFAATQRLEQSLQAPQRGTFGVQLEYRPVGPELEPDVAGRVVAGDGAGLAGYSIELVNPGPPRWSTGKIGLPEDGVFFTTVWAEKGRQNRFDIELYDPQGTRQHAQPEQFTYTVGAVFTEPPLINSVGIALANNEVEFFLRKGVPLPARHRNFLRTVFEVRAGKEGDLIRIPIVEGEHPRADRDRPIGELIIAAHQIRRDVPVGSEVEVSVEIDASRLVRAKAFIPLLDEEFEAEMKLELRAPDPVALGKRRDEASKRLEEANKRAADSDDDANVKVILRKIESENMLAEVGGALSAAACDRDAADKADKRLLDLEVALDQIDGALAWPALVAEARSECKEIDHVVRDYGDAGEKTVCLALVREIDGAIDARDADIVRAKLSQLQNLSGTVLRRQPGYWVAIFRRLERDSGQMTDPVQARQLLADGNNAIRTDDLRGLQSAVRQLVKLLPREEQQKYPIQGGLQR